MEDYDDDESGAYMRVTCPNCGESSYVEDWEPTSHGSMCPACGTIPES